MTDTERAAAARQMMQLWRPQQPYPASVLVDFTKLRPNALRRYLAHYGIQEMPGSSKEQLAVVVARHFNEECKHADEEENIASFLAYIKKPAGQAKEAMDQDQSSGNFDEMQTEAADRHEDKDDDEDDDPRRDNDPFHVEQDSSTGSLDDELMDPFGLSEHQVSSSHKKKRRKTRLYCVCKGTSFGDMIACDNKRCLDRSNWYHMTCVGLDPSQEPPETWFCPSCQNFADLPEHQYRKPASSVTYGDMISHALTALPGGKGSFKEICEFVEREYESQLNWKLESDQRKSPVWKSSVRKILFSNMRFRKHPDGKGLFCLAA